ncbi:hypothetical protein LPJ81_002123 [Coemansia sp. IMI 209127]|nr:hypothetical protein LPJ81_002123 [Coemansia sp. IMI 209127]
MNATHLTQINLSNNTLTVLPDEIGRLRQLQSIDLSRNKLKTLPPAVALWQHLHTMDVSNNCLADLPSAVRHLGRLEVFNIANNRLASVPRCLWKMQTLRLLDLSHNPIDVLPARMFIHGGSAAPNRGRLELLLLEGCPLAKGEPPSGSLSASNTTSHIQRNTIPPLVDIVLHRLIVSNSRYPFELPEHLQQRLKSFVSCDYCHRLYPAASGIKRWSFVYRDKAELPVEYSLCQAHWHDEKSRIASMFAPRMPEHAQSYYKAKKAALVLARSALVDVDCPFGAELLPPRQGLGRRIVNALSHKKKHNARDRSISASCGQNRPARTIWQIFEDE